MSLIISTIIMLVVFAYWRDHNNSFVSLKFTSKLYSLRNELIKEAIRGNVDHKSEVFNFWKDTIDNTIKTHDDITVFSVVSISILRKDYLVKESNKIKSLTDENEALIKISKRFSEHLDEYLVAQHNISYNLFRPIIASVMIASKLNDKFKRWALIFTLFNNRPSQGSLAIR